MPQLLNSFETGADEATVSAANSGGGADSAFDAVVTSGDAVIVYDTARAAHGSASMRVSTGSNAVANYAVWSTSMGAQATHYGRGYFFFTAYPSTGARLFQANAGANVCGGLRVSNTGKVVSYDASSASVQISATSVSAGAWFRIEWKFVGSATAGQIEYQLFNTADDVVPTEVRTSATTVNTRGAPDGFRFGTIALTTGIPAYWVDCVGVDTAGYLGPVIDVEQTVVQLWAVRTPVTAANAQSWVVVGRVDAAVAQSWMVRAPVVQSAAGSWNVAARVGQSLAQSWSVRLSAVRSVVESWRVRAVLAAPKTIAQTWAVRHVIAPDGYVSGYNRGYTAAGNTYKATGQLWAARAAVTSTSAQSWAVCKTVVASKAAVWAVRTVVVAPATLAQVWAVCTSVAPQAVAQSWAVRRAATSVVAELWNVRAQSTRTAAQIWRVCTVVPSQSFAQSWSVAVAISVDVAQSWTVRREVVQTVAETWITREILYPVGNDIFQSWDVLVVIGHVPSDYGAGYTHGYYGVHSATVDQSWVVYRQVIRQLVGSWIVSAWVYRLNSGTVWRVTEYSGYTHGYEPHTVQRPHAGMVLRPFPGTVSRHPYHSGYKQGYEPRVLMPA